MTRLLITRPLAEAATFAARLAPLGITALIDPLLTIEPTGADLPPLDPFVAIAVTSRQGAQALAAATPRRDLRLVAVGQATATVLRESGFAEVTTADGDVAALSAFIARSVPPGPLLHAAGTTVAGDLAGSLAGHGFAVTTVALYRAVAARALSAATRAALSDGSLNGAAFFSPRSAAVFVNLTTEESLTDTVRTLDGYCLSTAVADAARALPWRRLLTATRPDAGAMVELIDGARLA